LQEISIAHIFVYIIYEAEAHVSVMGNTSTMNETQHTLATALQYLDSFTHITKQQSCLKLSTQVLANFSFITTTLLNIYFKKHSGTIYALK